MDNFTIATIGVGVLVALTLVFIFLPPPGRRSSGVPVFKPRVITKIKSTYIKEDKE